MSCIINFIHPIKVDFPSDAFDGEVLLIEYEPKKEWGYHHYTTIYFNAGHLPILRELVAALEKIEAAKAVVVEKTDHAECEVKA